MAKKPDPFHNPFKGMKLKPAEAPKKAEPPKPPPPSKQTQSKAAEDDEAEFFRRSVGSVERVVRGPKAVVTSGPPPLDAIKIRREDDEVLEELALLIAGDGPFDVTESSEYLLGHVAGLDDRIIRRLRAGEYAVQGRLDLHGMSRNEAKTAVERFVVEARRAGKRCVLVVHGRGLNSPAQIPVLKDGVQQWLAHGRLAREVLAFCSARAEDGGAGAVYVLLRR